MKIKPFLSFIGAMGLSAASFAQLPSNSDFKNLNLVNCGSSVVKPAVGAFTKKPLFAIVNKPTKLELKKDTLYNFPCVLGCDIDVTNGTYEKSSVLNTTNYSYAYSPSNVFEVIGTVAGQGRYVTTTFENRGIGKTRATAKYEYSDYGENDIYTCDTNFVFVQTQPQISFEIDAYNDGNFLEGNFNITASQDEDFSMYGVTNQPVRNEVQWKRISNWNGARCEVVEDSSSWVQVRGLSTSNQLPFDERCEVTYRFRSFDGAHYSSWNTRIIRGPKATAGGGGTGGGSGGGGTGGGCTRRCDMEP